MSRIMDECNKVPPLKIYHTWGRWRLVKTIHEDQNGKREQYALQRYSSQRNGGIVWHLVAFFWSIEDLNDFINALNNGADRIEEVDGDNVLERQNSRPQA